MSRFNVNECDTTLLDLQKSVIEEVTEDENYYYVQPRDDNNYELPYWYAVDKKTLGVTFLLGIIYAIEVEDVTHPTKVDLEVFKSLKRDS